MKSKHLTNNLDLLDNSTLTSLPLPPPLKNTDTSFDDTIDEIILIEDYLDTEKDLVRKKSFAKFKNVFNNGADPIDTSFTDIIECSYIETDYVADEDDLPDTNHFRVLSDSRFRNSDVNINYDDLVSNNDNDSVEDFIGNDGLGLYEVSSLIDSNENEVSTNGGYCDTTDYDRLVSDNDYSLGDGKTETVDHDDLVSDNINKICLNDDLVSDNNDRRGDDNNNLEHFKPKIVANNINYGPTESNFDVDKDVLNGWSSLNIDDIETIEIEVEEKYRKSIDDINLFDDDANSLNIVDESPEAIDDSSHRIKFHDRHGYKSKHNYNSLVEDFYLFGNQFQKKDLSIFDDNVKVKKVISYNYINDYKNNRHSTLNNRKPAYYKKKSNVLQNSSKINATNNIVSKASSLEKNTSLQNYSLHHDRVSNNLISIPTRHLAQNIHESINPIVLNPRTDLTNLANKSKSTPNLKNQLISTFESVNENIIETSNLLKHCSLCNKPLYELSSQLINKCESSFNTLICHACIQTYEYFNYKFHNWKVKSANEAKNDTINDSKEVFRITKLLNKGHLNDFNQPSRLHNRITELNSPHYEDIDREYHRQNMDQINQQLPISLLTIDNRPKRSLNSNCLLHSVSYSNILIQPASDGRSDKELQTIFHSIDEKYQVKGPGLKTKFSTRLLNRLNHLKESGREAEL